MMQSCSNCGFEGQPGARFCRQCGSPLFVEREVNLSETRQQRFPPDNAPQEAWSTHNQWAGESTETSRFGRVAMRPAPYSIPPPTRNSQGFWTLTAIICALATFGLIAASLLSFRPERVPNVGERIAAEIGENVRRETARQAQEAARLAAEKARLAAEIARTAEEAAKTRGAASADGLSLDNLIYPKATVTNRISTGNSAAVVKLETSDEIAQVRTFYTAQLGEPQIATKSRLTFVKSENGVDLVVKVAPAETRGKVEISMARSARRTP